MNANQRIGDSRERGAALISTLLIATLLLIVGGALVLTTQLGTGLAIDSTTELQAYYAAEAGVNSALSVLRGNVAAGDGTKATFRNAVSHPNLNTWLNYGTTIGGNSAVSLSNSPVMGYSVSLTDPDNTAAGKEPVRLKLSVTGYGPRGSRKQMELMVTRYAFDFFPAATILVRGNDNGSSAVNGFAIGASDAKTYSGFDHADPTRSIPVFGVTQPIDFSTVLTNVEESKPNTVSAVDKVSQFNNSQLPDFLKTADNARDFLDGMQSKAQMQGRYFTTTPADFGTYSEPKFTFVDGDCTLNDGSGLLIVTGKLTSNGNNGFRGIILVLGEGVMERDGGGNGDTWGAIVVAKFDRESHDDRGFRSATYNMD
ncbi:MAG TPA: hypothetical protein VKB46_13700, partial [Pyrinomonadaceae bacterium]|nr:hypothetical protein [Pyrinomonadaceae bacterium]